MTDGNRPEHQGRLLTGVVAFLHYSTLGSVLPFLPLYLTHTVGLTWTQTGLVVGAFPLGGLLAPLVMRGLLRLGVDVRMGLAISHLLAAGIVMSSESVRQNSTVDHGQWEVAFCAAFAYAVMLSPSLGWMLDVATQPGSVSPGRDWSRSAVDSGSDSFGTTWRLWGAVGFLAPAWFIESVLARQPDFQDSVTRHEFLPAIAGWSGALTALAAIVAAVRATGPARVTASTDDKTPVVSIPIRVALLIGLLAGSSRLHVFWTAPFFDDTFQRLGIVQPLLYRITVTGQIFEVLALVALPACLRIVRPRSLALAGCVLWLIRTLTLAAMARADVAPRDALLAMCLSQTLGGIAIVWCFGALAVMVGNRGVARITPIAGWSSWVFLVMAGWSTDSLLGNTDGQTALARIVTGILPNVELQTWSLLWLVTALPLLVATALLVSGGLAASETAASGKAS